MTRVLLVLLAALLVGALASQALSQWQRADDLRARLDACAAAAGYARSDAAQAVALADHAEWLLDTQDLCVRLCAQEELTSMRETLGTVQPSIPWRKADAGGAPPPGIAREP